MYNFENKDVESIENSDELKLNTKWKLWYHSPENKKWDIESYILIKEINDVTEFWNIYTNLIPSQVQYGMFFLMRDDILPIWEDVRNINGGCWSFKVSKKDTYNAWIELCMAAVGEKITPDINKTFTINGVTISPKKNFSIIKIWNSDKDISDISVISDKIPNIILSDSLYNAHEDKS